MPRIEDPKAQPAYFDKELAHVGAQTHQPLDPQTSLLRRRNERGSPIYTLPLEVLVAILLMSCACERASWDFFGEPTDPQVGVLSSVSSYWREVVLQTPGFWSAVTLVAEEHMSEVVAVRLQHYFNHAGKLDLSVDLLLNGYSDFGDDKRTYGQQCQSIADVLFAPKNTQNIITLRIKNFPHEWLAKLQELPRLHTLVINSLHLDDATRVNPDFGTQPICRLSLACGMAWRPWESIVFIDLPSPAEGLVTESEILPDILVIFLLHCPNLIRVDYWDSECRSIAHPAGPAQALTAPLTMDHLETLHLPVNEWLSRALLQNLFLPALKHLHLECDDNESPALTIAFCHHFSETLKSLELHGRSVGWEAREFRRLLLHRMELLEMLKLTEWHPLDLIMAIGALTPSDKEFDGNDTLLPGLQSLVLSTWSLKIGDIPTEYLPPLSSNDPELVEDVVDLFLVLLEKRRASEVTGPNSLDLTVLCSESGDVIWSEELEGKITKAKVLGLQTVVQGGEYLDS